MTLTADDLKTTLTVFALFVSLLALFFTRVHWRESNRPIVTAFVAEHASGNMAATFNLVVSNTGNRPAVRVQLHATPEAIRALLEPGAPVKYAEDIEGNFHPSSQIPLLRNGEELTTSFGAFLPDRSDGPWLNYGAQAEITITYEGIEGRRFESRLPLKVYARDGFGGGTWESKKS